MIDELTLLLRIGVPGNHDSSARTAQFGQIAGGSHANLEAAAFLANDRTIMVRLEQCALEASTAGTATMA